MDNIIKRDIRDRLVEDLDKDTITILLGPRQVGKTTLIINLIDHLKAIGTEVDRIFYYNFDDVDLRGRIKSDFYYLKKDIETKTGRPIEKEKNKLFLFLDEGQKRPEIFDLVKIFYDRRYPVKIFISGSSSLNVKDKSAETLSGRVSYFFLSPLTFSENTGLKSDFYQKFEEIKNTSEISQMAALGYSRLEEIQAIFRKMLFLGGLPKITGLNNDEALIYLNNFLSSYLDRDVKDIGAKVNIESFHLSFKYLASYCADLFNFSKLGQDLGIKRDSLYRYFELLEKTLVIKTISPSIFPQMKNVFKSRKLFFFDSGIVNRLKGFLNFEEVERASFEGKLFENFIFQNLYAKSLNNIKKPDFYYFRDYQDHEIDLIYQRGEKSIPIEVTYSSSVGKDKLRNFSKFFTLHTSSSYGLIFYLGDIKEYRLKNHRVFAVPYFLI